jgi:membrane associated rhomboid family serine protease
MAYSSSGFRNPFGFTVTPWVKRLLIANGVVFLLVFALRGLVDYLAFTPAEVLSRPWTPLTYMFVHAGLFHLLFNMLGLFFFGPPLEERWGGTEFIRFFLVAGIGGALLSFLFPHVPIIGASAAVYGILVAYAMYWPDNQIYIWAILPVKAKWLVLFLIGMSIFYTVAGGASHVAHLAHLGGAAAAFLYLKSGWGPSSWGPILTRRRKRNIAVVQPSEPAQGTGSRPSVRKQVETLDEIDRILDKISEGGLESLTDSERRRLDEASRKYKTN